MKKHLLALGLLLAGVSPAQALDVGDISSFMNSGSSTLSKTIKNSTDSGRLINIHLERLSSPLDGGQVIPMDKPDEVLLTPASLLLPAQASDVIRFFYKGPADDKERYYRIVWFDQALSDAQRDNANRSAVPSAHDSDWIRRQYIFFRSCPSCFSILLFSHIHVKSFCFFRHVFRILYPHRLLLLFLLQCPQPFLLPQCLFRLFPGNSSFEIF